MGRFFETQSSTGQRYTVTLPNGTKIQEVNSVTAAQMVPFDSVTFTGHFNSMTDVSTEVAKRAAEKAPSTTTSPASGRTRAAAT